MSYAAAAAKGPKQTAEEKRAPAPPEVVHADSASTSSLIDVDSESVHTVPSDFTSHSVTTDTQASRIEREAEQDEAQAEEAEKKAKKAFHEKELAAKAKAKKAAGKAERNSDNPVFVGNAVAVVALSAGLGFGAYRKYAAGELTWKVAAAWTGVVGVFAAGDYYLSQRVLLVP
ncbi:MAG: hypothetical protein M1818_007075 [Claussenomyces sp. TS43310]|nr:MAG: hypothetical protein M1818_007075 [Claussenomyces sp. TS43310]